MQKTYQLTKLFTKTQIFFICFGIISQTSFFVTIQYFFQRGVWGYPRLGWIITDRVVHVGWFDMSSTTLLSCHVASSVTLYVALVFQLGLMLFVPQAPAKRIAHRMRGWVVAGILLPLFVFFALVLNLSLIHNQTNQILFGVIPVMIIYGFFKAICAIRSDDQASHIDGVFLVLMCLNAAAITRFAMAFLYLGGIPVSFLFNNHEPIVFGAIVRTIFLILILFYAYRSSGRLNENKYPLLILLLVLVVAVLV